MPQLMVNEIAIANNSNHEIKVPRRKVRKCEQSPNPNKTNEMGEWNT